MPLRGYIHRLHTNIDPAGDQRNLVIARDTIDQRQVLLVEKSPAGDCVGDPRGIEARHELNAIVQAMQLHSDNEASELLWKWAMRWFDLRKPIDYAAWPLHAPPEWPRHINSLGVADDRKRLTCRR
jgi:hypothetical protein